MAEIEQKLLEHPYDLVITTSYRKYGGDPDTYQSAWAPIIAAGSRIAVLADTPQVSEEALDCLTRVSFDGDRTGDCGTPSAEAFERPDPLVEAASMVQRATLIDLTPYYCSTDRCPSVIGNVIVYRDIGAHPTATFARTLSPAIVDGVRRALGAT
jgi:hypothetical protein